jgi:nucleotide-binding universal stress UspA family protein
MVTLPERSKRVMHAHSDHANPARRGPVVLATDGTSRSGAVVLAARLLADRLDVPLEVVSVLEPGTTGSPPPRLDVHDDAEIVEARYHARETAVCDYVCRYSGGASPARIHLRDGDAATQIVRFARDVSATMIVVGPVRHRLSDAEAAEVLRSADCPVLSVPPGFRGLPRTVAVAVDSGSSSVRAAQTALLLVADGGSVVLTHALPPLDGPAAPSAEPDTADGVRVLFEHLKAELAPAVPGGVKLETRVVVDREASLDGFTRRNTGPTVMLEVDDPDAEARLAM